MKRFNILLFLICFSCNLINAKTEMHKVIKVIDGDTVYVDFNDNGIAEQDEKVRINGVDTCETKPSVFLYYQMKKLYCPMCHYQIK